ncbi:hypothetical protein PIB30_023927 [Stylosanthes scabra]|uniref:Transposase MuDR plant domain-containing protein n=1 Tax=Stylosanthes scabra TaxID=79078 RepID=A0ABU6VBV7_9FABA|nr:hypothetical protein [Stylosanthes scabra]
MQPANTLEELKSVILRNIGVVGSMLVRRVAYWLLNLFPSNQFKFKIFWVDSDAHVRGSTSSSLGGTGAIIAAPIQIATPEVGDDDSDEDFIGNTDESSESSDGSEFVPESQARQGFLLPTPSPIPDSSSVGSHFHTLNLDDMVEEPMEEFGEGGEDYDLDGGSKFRVGHLFSTREAVHMAVKNYNIRRASEYRVVESDPYKYVCRCKRYNAGCPWSLRVALRTNLGYWYGDAEVWGTARLFGTVNVLRSRSVRRQTDLQLHLADNKGQSFRAHSSLAIRPSIELLLHAVLQEGLVGQAEGNREVVW